jgi:hypothetical protein
MDSTLRLLIVALAMLGAFLIGASSAGTWVPIGGNQVSGYPVASSLNTRTGQICFSVMKKVSSEGSEVNVGCSKEAQ